MKLSTDYQVLVLRIRSFSGEVLYDIIPIFEELNLFNGLLVQPHSGSVVVRDSIGMFNNLSMDGNETIEMVIKSDTYGGIFEAIYRIYGAENRFRKNATTEVYSLLFVEAPQLTSDKKKMSKTYWGGEEYYSKPPNLGIWAEMAGEAGCGIGSVHLSNTVWDLVAPFNIHPLEGTDWVSRRAINAYNEKPDFVSYNLPVVTGDRGLVSTTNNETPGWCFHSLSLLMIDNTIATYKFVSKDTLRTTLIEDYYSFRDWKVMSNFDMNDAYRSGVFGGTFEGWDPITRKWKRLTFTFSDLYKPYSDHLNLRPDVPESLITQEGSLEGAYAESRISHSPYQQPRKQNGWIKSHNEKMAKSPDNQEKYIFQRRHMFGLLKQKRLQITVAGNFWIRAGKVLNLEIPDGRLSGRYLIMAVRHIMKYDRFETVVEIASDSY